MPSEAGSPTARTRNVPAVAEPAEPAGTVFVLASASPARATTLRSAGIEPLIRVSNVDEDAVLARFDDPDSASRAAEKVVALAEAKGAAVVPELNANDIVEFAKAHGMPRPAAAIVLAADSMLEVNGALVGKPHSPEVAATRIRELSGNSVVLHTGHALFLVSLQYERGEDSASGEEAVRLSAAKSRSSSCATTVNFTELDEDEIQAYIATGEPLEVAGSFTIDGLGGPFIAGVEGDPHSVVGVSLPLVRAIAKELGVFWPSLWNRI
ncbi:MAG: Maf family protein [Actinomycetaceae bacterium]|nr:Maf family protein [Actinomycetaceae bacterium]